MRDWDWETIVGWGVTLGIPIVGALIALIVHASSSSNSSANYVESASGSSKSVYYRDCDAARSAGAAPMYRGEAGYRSALDRDGDGVACEPYKGR